MLLLPHWILYCFQIFLSGRRLQFYSHLLTLFNLSQNDFHPVKVYFLMYERQCSEISHYVNLIPHWEWKNVFMGWLSSVMTTFPFLSLRWGKSVKKLNSKSQWKCSIMLSCRLNPQIPFTLYTCFKEIETHGLCYSFFFYSPFLGAKACIQSLTKCLGL